MSIWLGVLNSQRTLESLALLYASQDIPFGSNNYSLSPTVVGGAGVKTYSVTSGSLPAGFTFNSGSGVITGPASTVWGGSRDTSFDTALGGAPNGAVWDLALQSDGKILIGGAFTSVAGVSRSRVARLNSDGSLDTSFGNGLSVDQTLTIVTPQSSGKVLIGGYFTSVNGASRNYIARLNSDGSLDTSFGNALLNNIPSTIAVHSDGKILIGGAFTSVAGVSRSRVARLNSDGSLDTSFGNGLSGVLGASNATVDKVALQQDGKVLIGGYFTSVNGVSRNHIARLNSDGSLDTSFGNGLSGASASIRSLQLQPDGKILIGGGQTLTSVNGVSRTHIARLNPDGSTDTSFNPVVSGSTNNAVLAIALQTDGKIIIGGFNWTLVNGVSRTEMARLNSDGSTDTSFGNELYGMGVITVLRTQSDGKILSTSGNNSGGQGLSRWMGGTAPTLPATVGVTVSDQSGSTTASLNITRTLPPTAVPSLTATGVAPSVELGWGVPAGGGAFSYRVEYSGVSASGPWTTWSASQSTTSTVVTGLTTGLQYWFRVTATNASGSSLSGVITTYGMPGVPTGLTATVDYQQITYSWTAPTVTGGIITGYVIERSSDGVTWTAAGTSTTTSYTLTGISNGETVQVRVAAYNPGNVSAFTSPVTATTPTPKATGGTIGYSAGTWYHTFTASGNFTPSTYIGAASGLVVAGGTNGGGGTTTSSGAGGSGGTVSSGTQAIDTSLIVVVGAVGNGSSSISGWLSASGIGTPGPAGVTTESAGLAGTSGTASSISGSTTVYGSSGGSGGRSTTTVQYDGGIGGVGAGNGGFGRRISGPGSAATTYGSGGGGGGGGRVSGSPAGAGMQGVVIISYPA